VIWSFSDGVSFMRCQRRWYYRRIVAAARAKDPVRREAYILGKFGTVASWRGRVVDEILSDDILPHIDADADVSLDRTLDFARDRFERQVSFALSNRVRDDDFTMTAAGADFAAFKEVEDGQPPSAERLEGAWGDISTALTTFFRLDGVLRDLRDATGILTQRALTMRLGEDSVRAFPDALVFRDGRAPMVMDWKVQSRRTRSAAPQLWTYAIVLANARPHGDFPRPFRRPTPADVDLVEVQLLAGSTHAHSVDAADQARVRARIRLSLNAMKGVAEAADSAFDVQITADEHECRWCSYFKLCGRKPVGYDEE
jgi:hypothetical protein